MYVYKYVIFNLLYIFNNRKKRMDKQKAELNCVNDKSTKMRRKQQSPVQKGSCSD